MKPTLVFTLYDRPWHVVKCVLDSCDWGDIARTIVCFDRTPKELLDLTRQYFADRSLQLEAVEIVGEKGWRCPAKAWNLAFARLNGDDLAYLISSEVIQRPGNFRLAEQLNTRYEQSVAIFGKATCSCGPQGKEVTWPDGAPGNLLVDAKHPRPLGFVAAMPARFIKQTGGFDENFMQGLWYDDDDFFTRLWLSKPIPPHFLFTDQIEGIHQHHDRPDLDEAKILINQNYVQAKFGTTQPLSFIKSVPRTTTQKDTLWLNPNSLPVGKKGTSVAPWTDLA